MNGWGICTANVKTARTPRHEAVYRVSALPQSLPNSSQGRKTAIDAHKITGASRDIRDIAKLQRDGRYLQILCPLFDPA